jgi:dihydroorotase
VAADISEASAVMRLPGLIDPHVHLREPGGEHKEDFASGSAAALAGGFTFVIDMPNNALPTITLRRLREKVALASRRATCEVGFHYGTTGTNLGTFAAAAAADSVYGLKVYCNHTTGDLLVDDPHTLQAIFTGWPVGKPILVHAEGRRLAATIELAALHGQRLHVCHISQASEVEWVREAKRSGVMITAGVCPHHLWLTSDDEARLGGYAVMKPPLGTASDQEALWEGLRDGTIDLVESDHAPHTRPEKEAARPAFGVTGLETTLGLICKGVREGRLSLALLAPLLHSRAAAIFSTPAQPDTYVEFDPRAPYEVAPPYATKCGWTPFEGWVLFGKPQSVVFRGRRML